MEAFRNFTVSELLVLQQAELALSGCDHILVCLQEVMSSRSMAQVRQAGRRCEGKVLTFVPRSCSRRGTTGVSLNLSSGPSFGLPCMRIGSFIRLKIYPATGAMKSIYCLEVAHNKIMVFGKG